MQPSQSDNMIKINVYTGRGGWELENPPIISRWCTTKESASGDSQLCERTYAFNAWILDADWMNFGTWISFAEWTVVHGSYMQDYGNISVNFLGKGTVYLHQNQIKSNQKYFFPHFIHQK